MTEQHLRQAIEAHRQSVAALETELNAVLSADTLQENTVLRDRLQTLEAQCAQTQQELQALQGENRQLRQALQDQLFQERAGMVGNTRNKLAIYFSQGNAQALNRLQQEELQVRSRIDRVRALVQQRHAQQRDGLLAEVAALEQRERQLFDQSRGFYTKAPVLTPDEDAAFAGLAAQPLTPEQMQKAARTNNMEHFLGQNLINKAGILLIVIGVLAASQYTLLRLPDVFKGLAMFLLGALLLMGGELLNRRKANVVSLGITAGGVAVLYVAVAVSYFGLQLLGALPAVLVCIVITSLAFFLSQRYNTQTIAAFALIGGYLPVLAVGDSSQMLYGMMAYLVALNLLALLFATGKRWMTCAFLGFGLNLVTTLFLCFGVWARLGQAPQFGGGHLAVLLYLFFTLLVYTAVPMLSVYRARKPFAAVDVVLLGLNTVLGSTILFCMLPTLQLADAAGALALVCAVCYVLLGRLVRTSFLQAQETDLLFTLTGLGFLALAVPLQLHRSWYAMAWLAEGVVLTVYGILRGKRLWRLTGVGICGLCAAAFFSLDFIANQPFFGTKYFALTLGSLLVAAALLRVGAVSVRVTMCKLAAAVNLWAYLCYACGLLLRQFPGAVQTAAEYSRLAACLSLVVTVLLAWAFSHWRALREPLLPNLGLGMYLFAALSALALCGTVKKPLANMTPGTAVLATVVLVVVGVAAMFALWEALHALTRYVPGLVRAVAAILCVFGLLLLTEAVVVQFRVEFSSLFISLLYGAAAVVWVVWGFLRANAGLRRTGLMLALATVAKLFLLDLFFLTEGYRILCYFALGVSLVAISLLYQYFSRHFETAVFASAQAAQRVQPAQLPQEQPPQP